MIDRRSFLKFLGASPIIAKLLPFKVEPTPLLSAEPAPFLDVSTNAIEGIYVAINGVDVSHEVMELEYSPNQQYISVASLDYPDVQPVTGLADPRISLTFLYTDKTFVFLREMVYEPNVTIEWRMKHAPISADNGSITMPAIILSLQTIYPSPGRPARLEATFAAQAFTPASLKLKNKRKK